jgi:ribonuclease HII
MQRSPQTITPRRLTEPDLPIKPPAKLKHCPGATGLDEAGRGPLAGPVVAAAVVLPRGFDRKGIRDSKKLTPKQREELAKRIKSEAAWAMAVVEVEEVDRLNIFWASMAAMRRALEALPLDPEIVFVDGNRIPPDIQIPCKLEAVVKGDDRLACVAAASIIAKTTRDRLMKRYAEQYPGYGFESHFGYCCPMHFRTLRELGPCAIHRRTFAPVQEALQGCLALELGA